MNHTPSFATDSPLDKELKYALIKDTFNLLNFDPEKKTRYISRMVIIYYFEINFDRKILCSKELLGKKSWLRSRRNNSNNTFFSS